MSDYRINVRFHDDNEEERRAAEYLKTLHRSRNQFVVDDTIEILHNLNYVVENGMALLEKNFCSVQRLKKGAKRQALLSSAKKRGRESVIVLHFLMAVCIIFVEI